MKFRIIGIGAAGNKSVIEAIKMGIVDTTQATLLNTTFKDIPSEFEELTIKFSEDFDGCGKERDIAKNKLIEFLSKGKLNLEEIIKDEDMVVIVNSSEGGTGCGASTVLAKYIKEVVNKPVSMFVFTGFEDDLRGIRNTIEYFKELDDSYVVQAISNKKFLKEAGNNKVKAEKLATEDFCAKLRVLTGSDIIPSETNIDDTDLLKLTTSPGYMVVETVKLDNIKNKAMFNECISETLDSSKVLEFEPSAKRIGLIFNISEKTVNNIDWNFDIIKERFGQPFEIYQHIQNVHETESVSIISSGMDLPTDEVFKLFQKYTEDVAKIKKPTENSFANINLNTDSSFDLLKQDNGKKTLESNKSDFFKEFNIIQRPSPVQPPSSRKNSSQVSSITMKEDEV